MDGPTTDPQLRQRIKDILRRDLKLGPDARIDDDGPLFDSDADLDSLDMLLLVSSLEREFGIKIPSEAVGETVFRSVSTIAQYVAEHRPKSKPGPAQPSGGTVNPLDRLPHGDPFRFVTKLVSWKADDTAEGIWAVTGTEAFFAGHFPGKPLVPGVLIAEALAQLSGLIAPPAGATGGKLAHVDVRFENPVAPPAEIALASKLVRKVVSLQQFEVTASVGEKTVARGTLAIQHGGA
jgi:3-hydroxyacyl-[acyl-carrier-protein] dehydratase